MRFGPEWKPLARYLATTPMSEEELKKCDEKLIAAFNDWIEDALELGPSGEPQRIGLSRIMVKPDPETPKQAIVYFDGEAAFSPMSGKEKPTWPQKMLRALGGW